MPVSGQMPLRSGLRSVWGERRVNGFEALRAYIFCGNGVYMAPKGTGTVTSIRLDKKLADEAAKAYGVKTRTEAVHLALREAVRLMGFKKLMKEHGGKGTFAGIDE